MGSATAYTIGHSNRTREEFGELLQANGIDLLVDVRRLPGSRRYPHFDQDRLQVDLPEQRITYEHAPALTGRRRTAAGVPSINTGWRNASFRAYADHMQTDEFHHAVDWLVSAAGRYTLVIMCAESVPWRCHRSLIADALLIRGVRVRDILGPTSVRNHDLTSFAQYEGERLWYPDSQEPLFEGPQSAGSSSDSRPSDEPQPGGPWFEDPGG